jgi:glycosyltransferase involved in cell wall biosynthesis
MVDATNVGPTLMGTQLVVIESVRALSRHPDVAEVIAVVPPSASTSALDVMKESGATIVVSPGPEHLWTDFGRADLVYRPSQVTRVAELKWLLAAAPRVVVNHLDCIAYNDPAYFDGWDRWKIYRQANELAARLVDGVTYLSTTSQRQSEMSGLGAKCPTSVVYSGTDVQPYQGPTKAPKGVSKHLSGFFLCLGASYKHKNRVAALRIFAAARAQGWNGSLVLAGPTPPAGNSLVDEDEFLLAHPDLRSSVSRVGALSEPEKEWLYERASVVLYPTLAEGFGLVPFEAAAHGVPCLSTRCGSLDEVLPTGVPTMDLGDIPGSARIAIKLASDESFAQAVCAVLSVKAQEFKWQLTGERLVDLFWEVLGRPSEEDRRLGEIDSLLMPEVSQREQFRLPAKWFGRMYPTLSWSIGALVERPSLRQALFPRGSRRAKLGSLLVRYIDRRTR